MKTPTSNSVNKFRPASSRTSQLSQSPPALTSFPIKPSAIRSLCHPTPSPFRSFTIQVLHHPIIRPLPQFSIPRIESQHPSQTPNLPQLTTSSFPCSQSPALSPISLTHFSISRTKARPPSTTPILPHQITPFFLSPILQH